MPDTIEERLAQLGTSLEDAAGFGSPALVRGRGEQLRVAHRRTVAMTAATAALVVIGAGSAIALSGGGGHQQNPNPISPGSSVRPTSSSSVTAPPAQSAPQAAKPIAVVDLNQHTMTVSKAGKAARTIAITAGTAAHPTTPGTFTVTAKVESEDGASEGPSSEVYHLKISWVVKLDVPGRFISGMPWNEGKFGKEDGTHGAIGMSTADAQWLYANVNVGDRIQIQ